MRPFQLTLLFPTIFEHVKMLEISHFNNDLSQLDL